MDVYECVRDRRTVREYRPDSVPREVTDNILRAGRWAPSSQNQQPWHFIVVENRETLKKLGEIAASGRFVAEAPMVIAIAMENAHRPELDAGRALQQMELVAWDEGLGTCFVGLRDADQNRRVKELLGVPEGMVMVTLLPFGYRPEAGKAPGKPRKPMSQIAHRELFGRAYHAV